MSQFKIECTIRLSHLWGIRSMICGLQTVRYTSTRLLPGRRAADVRGPSWHPPIAHRTRCLQRRHHSRLGDMPAPLFPLVIIRVDSSARPLTILIRSFSGVMKRSAKGPCIIVLQKPTQALKVFLRDRSSKFCQMPVLIAFQFNTLERVGRAGCYTAWHLFYFVACRFRAFTGLLVLAAIVILTLSLGVFSKPDTAPKLWWFFLSMALGMLAKISSRLVRAHRRGGSVRKISVTI